MDGYGLGCLFWMIGMGGIRVWIPRFARNDTGMGLSCCLPVHHTSGLRIKSAMTVCAVCRPFRRHSRVGGNP